MVGVASSVVTSFTALPSFLRRALPFLSLSLSMSLSSLGAQVPLIS